MALSNEPEARPVVAEAYGNGENSEDEISILDLLLVLAAGKKLIIKLTLACGILATIIAFIVPKTYTATALVMPPQQGSSGAAAMLGQLSNLTGGLAGKGLGATDPADVYIGILESRTVSDEVIQRFKLQDLYEEDTMVETRKALAKHVSFESTDAGLIQISFEDEDPQQAADVANTYVSILQERNNSLAVTEAGQRRLFFEQQLEDEKNKLAVAEGEFQNFQEKQGVIQPNSQMEAVITTMVNLRAEIATVEASLERLRTGATQQNPEVLRQSATLKTLREKLRQLESKNTSRNMDDPLLPTSMVPEAGMEYARQLREVKYRETLFELIAKQYEAARIEEAQESPVIQVVDDAVAPDKKSAPKRSLYVLAGLFLGCMAGVFIVFIRHAGNDPAQKEKITELKALLSVKR
ncbi:MAG: hypothetical protein LBP68_07550 [Acidobacteriota bacterium]|jgi:uncharacterized protein involved in exopolysaccharide biosynthesis|nr:hypothetical protein [Acidobacteriota bacterium]